MALLTDGYPKTTNFLILLKTLLLNYLEEKHCLLSRGKWRSQENTSCINEDMFVF